MEIIRSIQNRIYEIRGERVMLDKDLADLYEIDNRALNQAVKRNLKRFPQDFMFQLTKEEFESLRFQIETLDPPNPLRFQNETSKPGRGGTRYLPYVFTEQGVPMLSGVVNSDKAIEMNIAIMRAFVSVRHVLLKQNDLKEQLKEIKERLGEHDTQLNHIYDAMENLLDEKAAQRKWDERERIGFKTKTWGFKLKPQDPATASAPEAISPPPPQPPQPHDHSPRSTHSHQSPQ
jgi:hypothetical protein